MSRLRDNMVAVLARHTGQPAERIEQDIDRDYILRGADAVAYGLVDRVIEHKDFVAQPVSSNGEHHD